MFGIDSFEAFGNVSSASIPAAMAYELSNSLLKGRDTTLVLSGFGEFFVNVSRHHLERTRVNCLFEGSVKNSRHFL